MNRLKVLNDKIYHSSELLVEDIMNYLDVPISNVCLDDLYYYLLKANQYIKEKGNIKDNRKSFYIIHALPAYDTQCTITVKCMECRYTVNIHITVSKSNNQINIDYTTNG